MSATGEGPRPYRPMGSDSGTTLIEAMVVVAVTAIIGAIAFPVVSQGLAGAAFQEAAIGLRADLKMARAQALRTGEPVDVTVSEDGHGYGWTPGPQRVLLTGIRIAPAGGEVRFYPDGSSPGGSLQLANGRTQVDFGIDPDVGLLRDPR